MELMREKDYLRYAATSEIAKGNEVFGPSKRPEPPTTKNVADQLAGELASGLDKINPIWKSPYLSGADKQESSNPMNSEKVSEAAKQQLQNRLSKTPTNAPTPGARPSVAPTLTRK